MMAKTTQPSQRHRPGSGWRHLAGAVWEHECGVRVHVYGLVRCPGDHFDYNGAAYPESCVLAHYIRLNGGNRKRGVMAWALEVCRDNHKRSGEYPNPGPTP